MTKEEHIANWFNSADSDLDVADTLFIANAHPMDKIPNEINEIIRNFLIKLAESNIFIQKAILFGSYAKKNNNDLSDIDLALVSANFSGNPYFDNEIIRDAKLSVSSMIEAHTYTLDEFNESNPFVREILKHGIIYYQT